MVDDPCKQVGGDHELALGVADVEAQFRVHEGDHACKKFLLLGFGAGLQFLHVVNRSLYRHFLLVYLDELSLGLLFDLIWHLRLAHFREVRAHFLVYAFEGLQVAFGHLAAAGCQEYRLENKRQELFG